MADTTPINKTIYIRKPQAQTLIREMKPLSNSKKTEARSIVQKFITLLKTAHS